MTDSTKRWRQRFGTLALPLLALMLAVSACGSDASSDSSDEATSDGGSTADETTSTDESTDTADAEGDAEISGPSGTLVVGYVATVDSVSPFPQGLPTIQHRLALYDPLIAIDTAGAPVAMLAESWDFPDDGMSLTLHLREGVTFHDGTPFDSAIAVANIEMFKDPETNVQGNNVWAQVTASAPDANTVEMTFDQPLPEIFAIMNTAMITKPGELESGIGTGPFVLDEYKPREGLTFVANLDYWDPARPGVEKVELREFADTAAAALVAQSGELDILIAPLPSQAEQLEGAGLTIATNPEGGGYDILVNADNVTDPLVRQALSMAFDRERFVESILLGYGSPMSSIFTPTSPVWAEEDAPVTAFDLEGARALLDEAGVDTLDVSIMSPTVVATEQFLPIYQADLATIGINLSIESVDAATWAQAVASPGTIPDVATHYYGFADLDPALIFGAHPFRVGSNASNFNEAEYAELVETASATIDSAARYEAFRAVDAYVTEQAFMFPIANPVALTALAEGVSGYEVKRAGYDYSRVTLSE